MTRTLAATLVLMGASCATVPAPVAEYSVCERTCRATREHCTDDSAKERETGTTCEQDLRNCLDRCDAQAQADPSGREQISKPRQESIVDSSSGPVGRVLPRH